MARNKARRKRGGSLKPAQLNLSYGLNSGVSYIDLAQDLSMVNRRLYKQGKVYAVAGISYVFRPEITFPLPLATDLSVLSVAVATAGDTWSVQNSHTKGKALWNQMNRLVLADNPSIKGTWADFKVRLDDHHQAAGNADVLDGDGNAVLDGEWDYSTFVMPQHEVDPVTGLPLAADEFTVHLVGENTATSMGLVKAYAESRATVQPVDPAVPPSLSTSFFNLLTDSGSQEPELADVIEDANDQPPYDETAYPGGATNADAPWFQQTATASVGQPVGRVPGFQAECGLVKVFVDGISNVGSSIAVEDLLVIFHLMPGNYQGVLAENMGQ